MWAGRAESRPQLESGYLNMDPSETDFTYRLLRLSKTPESREGQLIGVACGQPGGEGQQRNWRLYLGAPDPSLRDEEKFHAISEPQSGEMHSLEDLDGKELKRDVVWEKKQTVPLPAPASSFACDRLLRAAWRLETSSKEDQRSQGPRPYAGFQDPRNLRDEQHLLSILHSEPASRHRQNR